MSEGSFYVILEDGAWHVLNQGQTSGPYGSQKDAFLDAASKAHETYKTGVSSEVMVQGRDRQFRREWIGGQHAFPPQPLPAVSAATIFLDSIKAC